MFLFFIGVILALDLASDADLNPLMSYTEILIRCIFVLFLMILGCYNYLKHQDIE